MYVCVCLVHPVVFAQFFFSCSELKHVECVMRDNVAVVRLNSPNNKVTMLVRFGCRVAQSVVCIHVYTHCTV